ncbi:MAG: hypothetical protein HC847_11910 [Hydrococcus sp. RU_2_2]|nr:hypothetical protein [Hydrococcus sp. RU_2_2]NJP18969.1 hypothetical protein [Hydrococcus sp. CRU_1_1]
MSCCIAVSVFDNPVTAKKKKQSISDGARGLPPQRSLAARRSLKNCRATAIARPHELRPNTRHREAILLHS